MATRGRLASESTYSCELVDCLVLKRFRALIAGTWGKIAATNTITIWGTEQIIIWTFRLSARSVTTIGTTNAPRRRTAFEATRSRQKTPTVRRMEPGVAANALECTTASGQRKMRCIGDGTVNGERLSEMENSSIQWLTRDGVNGATFNPWVSCSHATYVGSDGKEHVHPGCQFCYAENLMDKRYHKCVWGSNGNRVVTAPDYWRKPDTWNRKARNRYSMPVFPSLCDPFEDWQGPMVNASGARGWIAHDRKRKWQAEGDAGFITDEMRPMIMDDVRFDFLMLIDNTEWIDWLLFTKRPQNVRNMWPLHIAAGGERDNHRTNVTLCYSASNQETLLYGAPLVLECLDLCPVVGISLEPMLGSVNLRAIPNYQSLGWVIVGCESNGPRVGRLGDFVREADWWDGAAFVLQQCKEAGIPAYMKQGPCNGRVIHSENEFPASCRVRQFPTLPAV